MNSHSAADVAQSIPSLLLVGTGIEGASHTTLAAQRAIEQASKVLFAVADSWTVAWLRALRPDAESFAYGSDPGTPRREIYREMVERILRELRAGHRVCAVFYGNPALLTRPAHAALKQARDAGFVARMLPGVSSLDCLFADLGFDPGEHGCQMYEATEFIARERTIDVQTPLLLWQVAVVGNASRFDALPGGNPSARKLLCERLLARYPASQLVLLYQASSDCARGHQITTLPLSQLYEARLDEAVTLLIRPLRTEPGSPAPIRSFE
jgi:precorrin-6B methylase 1